MKEFEPYRLESLFEGNWDIFKEAVKSPQVIFVYDVDGILIDSPSNVFRNFEKINNVKVNLDDADTWDYLTKVATKNGLSAEAIAKAEDGWYDPEILENSPRYLYITSVLSETFLLTGAKNNFILTSREPNLEKATKRSIKKHFPEFLPENILIRDSSEIKPTEFKAKHLSRLSEKAKWVVFFEDSTKYAKAALDLGPSNCVVVNIPLGKIWPDFTHDRLISVKRFPARMQGMYALLDMIKRARNE